MVNRSLRSVQALTALSPAPTQIRLVLIRLHFRFHIRDSIVMQAGGRLARASPHDPALNMVRSSPTRTGDGLDFLSPPTEHAFARANWQDCFDVTLIGKSAAPLARPGAMRSADGSGVGQRSSHPEC